MSIGRCKFMVMAMLAGATLLLTACNFQSEEQAQPEFTPSDIKEQGYDDAWEQEECDMVVNPNCFAPASDGALLLADMYARISKVDISEISEIPCVDTTMRLPAAICEWEDEYYVADYRNNRIVVLDKAGHMTREWTHDELSDPEGITVDESGNIYVAGYGNGRILKFTPQGDFLASWNSVTSDEDTLVHPHGIFYYNGLLYITELQSPARVVVYTPQGDFVAEFGNDQTTEYVLEYPTALFIHGDIIYVADAVDCQIKLFSLDGSFIDSFGTFGMGSGQFYYPYGIGVDAEGNIYVGDTHNRRVQVFDSEWNLLKMYVEQEIDIGTPVPQKELRAIPVAVTESYSLEADSIAFQDETIFGINQKDGTLKVFDRQAGTQNIYSNDYSYPWSVKNVGDDIMVIDEPGALQLISNNGNDSIYYPLTGLQFNPPEIVDTFIYRFQDADIEGDTICLANTLPGNVLLLNSYGSYIASIQFEENRDLGTPRITGVALDGDNIFYADMKGSVGCVDLAEQKHYLLVSPIGMYQPYAVAVGNGFLAVTEPYAKRVQLWNSDTLEWVGYIDTSKIDTISVPWKVSFDGELLGVTSKKTGMTALLDLGNPTSNGTDVSYTAEEVPLIYDTVAPEVSDTDSIFLEIYHNRVSRAKQYWGNYRQKDGIVQYDFSFSFVSDNLPVTAGYGRAVWANGVAQYALLNHYSNTDDARAQEELHADWLVQNAVRNESGILYWPNNYEISNTDLQTGYMAASTQALGAAALVKAAEHFPDKAAEYLQVADSALEAFSINIEDGGVRTMLGDNVFFADYANGQTGYISYAVIPMAWTTAALYETGDAGASYYQEICSTWKNALKQNTLIGDKVFCSLNFDDSSKIHIWSSNLANTILTFINAD